MTREPGFQKENKYASAHSQAVRSSSLLPDENLERKDGGNNFREWWRSFRGV